MSSAGEGDLRVVVEMPGAILGAGVVEEGWGRAADEDVGVWVRELGPAECWVGRSGWGGSAGIASV